MEKKLLTVQDQALLELLKAISDSETLVSDLAGGFSFKEIGDLIAIATDINPVVKDATLIVPQWESLDAPTQATLVAWVQANCKFPASLTVEQWAQKILSAAVLLSSIFQVFQPGVN